jgi:hypothetical protein
MRYIIFVLMLATAMFLPIAFIDWQFDDTLIDFSNLDPTLIVTLAFGGFFSFVVTWYALHIFAEWEND